MEVQTYLSQFNNIYLHVAVLNRKQYEEKLVFSFFKEKNGKVSSNSAFSNLYGVASLFRYMFHCRYESPYWRGLAARQIQVAWRYRKKRISRADTSSSKPDH